MRKKKDDGYPWCTECGHRRGELTPKWDCDCGAEFPLTEAEIMRTYKTSPMGVYHNFFDKDGNENRPHKGLK